MTKLSILIIMFLAYSVAEYIFKERLNLIQRTFLLGVILLIGIYWRTINSVNQAEFYLVVPITALAYLAISYFEDKLKVDDKGRQLFNFSLKQIPHIIAICMIGFPFYQSIYPVAQLNISYQMLNFHKAELVFLVLILNIWLAPRLIRRLLNDLAQRTAMARGTEIAKDQLTHRGVVHAGKVIGILERLMVLITVLLAGSSGGVNIGVIGFILGAKSIARFKKFDNQEFVEYFIVGTLASILFALITIWPLKLIL